MPTIQVVPYEEHYRAQWEEFVLRSNNGTMFHLQRFLDYHPAGKFRFHHLLFFQESELIAVLPGGVTAAGAFESPTGASYGGFVLGDVTFEQCLDLVDALESYARLQPWNDLILTAAPFVYQERLTQNIDYALLWRGFFYDCHYISSVIDIRKYGDDVIEHFSRSARRTIRQSTRDGKLRIERNEDYEGFYPILVENKARHGVKPTHSLEDLHRLRELMPERCALYMAYLGDKPIAGSFNVVANSRVLLMFYNMLLYEHDDYRPLYPVTLDVVTWAHAQGFDYIDIGVSQDTKAANPMTPSMNLIAFKERFDSRGIMRSTLRKRLS